MEKGDYPHSQPVSHQVQPRPTVTLTLSQSTLQRWEEVARQNKMADHSAMAAFLLTQ